ncbi:MAG: DUF2920 family protein [Victivallales bacterium]|nr:DUF2920 family protein [Victivallales bacterium]
MKEYEFSYPSQGPLAAFPKEITCLVVEPDEVSAKTGVMLCAHGWGNPRMQTLEQMRYAAKEHGILSVSPEYRMSGYDYDPVKGHGWYQPYDLSYRQTFDCIQALRVLLERYPQVNRQRIYAYGTSQGGMIVLLAAIWAPSLFAAIYTASAMTRLPKANEALAYGSGRDFTAEERRLKDVPANAERLTTPVFLEHGTADETVPCVQHALRLKKAMVRAGHPLVECNLYKGGGHSLSPVTNRLETFKSTAPRMFKLTRKGKDSFAKGEKVEIPTGRKTLHIDWSRPVGDVELYQWR